jgi:hypothetical protein
VYVVLYGAAALAVLAKAFMSTPTVALFTYIFPFQSIAKAFERALLLLPFPIINA